MTFDAIDLSNEIPLYRLIFFLAKALEASGGIASVKIEGGKLLVCLNDQRS